MHAKIHHIQANDIVQWPGWAPATQMDEYQWFTVTIGPTDSVGVNIFQVLVASVAGLQTRRMPQPFVGLLVEHFVPAHIEQTIRAYVDTRDAATWDALVSQLQVVMRWEFASYQP